MTTARACHRAGIALQRHCLFSLTNRSVSTGDFAGDAEATAATRDTIRARSSCREARDDPRQFAGKRIHLPARMRSLASTSAQETMISDRSSWNNR